MPHLRLTLQGLFLIAVLTLTSGFRFHCFILCNDETDVQNDYIEQRDKCRDYAQLKVDTGLHGGVEGEDKSRKAQLISLFSECMGKNGWTVPSGKDEGPTGASAAPVSPTTPMGQATATTAAAAVTAQAIPTQSPAEAAAEQKAFLKRAGECAFARQAASASANAAARAKGCDEECSQRLRAAPESPRPAACPPATKTGGSNHD